MMAVAAAQKNREMFAIKKSYSIEVSSLNSVKGRKRCITIVDIFRKINEYRNLINFEGGGGESYWQLMNFRYWQAEEKNRKIGIFRRKYWVSSVRVSREKRGNFAARLNRHDSRASRYTSFISPFNPVSLSLFSVLYLLASYTETFERWFFSLKIYHDKSRNLFFSLTINTGICYLETWRTHQISLELSYTEEFSFFPFAYVTFLINVRYIS